MNAGEKLAELEAVQVSSKQGWNGLRLSPASVQIDANLGEECRRPVLMGLPTLCVTHRPAETQNAESHLYLTNRRSKTLC